MTTISKPKILIPRNVLNRMQAYVDLCDKEISGLGTVVYDHKYGGYVVKRVMLLEQEVSSSTTDLDDNAVAQALYEYREYEGKEEVAFWWHSHVNMNTFWSTTDHDTMDSIGKNGLCVAVVLNKKKEKRGAIVMAPKNFPAVKFDDVDIVILDTIDFSMDDIKKEIEAKVKEKTYSYVNPYQGAYDWKKGWGNQEVKDETKKETETKGQTTLLKGDAFDQVPVANSYRQKFKQQCELEWNAFGPAIKGAYNNDFDEYFKEALADDLSLGYGNGYR